MERKYIWLNDSKETAYVEFQEEFEYTGGKAVLKITADYKYAAFVNGQFVGNAQFTDIPEYKTFSEYDITEFVKQGENEISITAYHASEGASVCRVMTPCISFEIKENDKRICVSSEKTLCRKDVRYSVGATISGQQGKGYNYSFVEKEEPWQNSQVVQPNFVEYEKPIQNTYLRKRDCSVGAVGVFKKDGGETAAQMMQRAWLKTLRFSEVDGACAMKKELPLTFRAKTESDGIFIVGDLGCECAGFPYVTVDCEEETTAYLGWGEHLADLRLRTNLGNSNFGVEVKLKKGKNHFSEYLRRIGCRYLSLFVESRATFTVERFGLMEELYPLKKAKKDFGDKLLNQIYETGRRTLELCMHEHYEDCPWREQALYGMDSRNQMLFGYGAFNEYAFPRASLDLMARCIREDGWIPLVAPSELDLTIPPFSAYWILAVLENVERDYNEGFLKGVISAVEKIMAACKNVTRKNKIYSPVGKGLWNFHEWSDGLSGDEVWQRDSQENFEATNIADAPFTALVCRAAKAAAKLEEKFGDIQKAREFEEYAATLANGLYDFYDKEKEIFSSYIDKDGKKYGEHEYTQSLFLLTDELKEKEKNQVIKALKGEGESLVPVTLAGLALKYEALLNYSDSLAYVLEDTSKIFGKMLFEGATSYWETAGGESAFGSMGSLCHGWSSVACWVLDTYCKNYIKK